VVKIFRWKFVWLILGISIILSGAFFANRSLLKSNEFSLKFFLDNTILAILGGYLVVFLFVLIFRYVGLLFFSLSEHFNRILTHKDFFVSTQLDQSTLPMVSIIVPAYNEGLVIKAALGYLLTINYQNFEIIVVDDGSKDDTYQKILDMATGDTSKRIRFVKKPNGGKASALNYGASVARGELILNMDGDTKLSKDSLLNAVKHFDDPRVGAVAGNIKVLNRENTLTNLQALEYIEGLAMVRSAQGFMHMVSIVPGPFGLFRKSLISEVGGYDYDTYAEDCDLTLKILFNGWRIVYEPTAIAYVESPTKLLDLIQQRYRWTRGMLQALVKHSKHLFNPKKSKTNFLNLWYMAFETLIWPFSSTLGSLFFIYIGLQHGLVTLLFFWWLQLTILDFIAALYCILIEDEDLKLILYVPLFRMFYITIIDLCKVFSIIEECLGLSMTWGKIIRTGKV